MKEVNKSALTGFWIHIYVLYLLNTVDRWKHLWIQLLSSPEGKERTTAVTLIFICTTVNILWKKIFEILTARAHECGWPLVAAPRSCLVTWFKHAGQAPPQTAGDWPLTAHPYFKREELDVHREGRGRGRRGAAWWVEIGCGSSSPVEPDVGQLAGGYLQVAGQIFSWLDQTAGRVC